MNENEILAKMQSEKFSDNNGVILRAIHIGVPKYTNLAHLKTALRSEIDKADFSDSVNYLFLTGYINIRKTSSKLPADIADSSIDDLEAKVSASGIKLLKGKVKDDCVRT